MGQKDFNMNASINEFVFAKFIEKYNEDQLSKDKPLITATQGRKLHRAFLENIGQIQSKTGAGYTMQTVVPSVAKQALNQTFQDAYGEPMYTNENEFRLAYAGFVDQWFETTGWKRTKEAAADRQRGKAPMTGKLPISPFDERFAHRSTVLDHGTEVLYADMMDMVQFVPGAPDANGNVTYHMEYRNLPKGELGISMYAWRENVYGGGSYRMAGEVYSAADGSGLARLRPYLSDADYKAVSGWMTLDDDLRMTPQAMERSVGILQMLQENGIPYTISKDRSKGQLKANISNTKIHIRLTDTRQNENFIGRVYKDGHSLYLGASKPMGSAPFVPSVDEVHALVQYAIGQHPDRLRSNSSLAGQKVGSPSEKTKYQSRERERTTYISYGKDNDVNAPTLHTLLGYSNKQMDTGRMHMVHIHSKNNHSASHRVFADDAEAETFLRDAITSAKERFTDMVDVDRLVAEYEAHKDEEDYVPMFSGDISIAPIQQIYWDVLKGNRELYSPTEKQDDAVYHQLFDALGFLDEDPDELNEDETETVTLVNGEHIYTGTQEDKVRAHLRDSMDALFGTFEPNLDGKRFNPAMVSSFMASPFGIYRNNDNLVAAMYKLEFTGDEVRGDDFQTSAMKDRLLRFDETAAVPIREKGTPFMTSMFESIRDSIVETGCEVNPDDILIDDHGVVSYRARQMVGKGNQYREIYGKLGQIFEPDSQGLIETDYNGSDNKLFSPGYDAYIVPVTADTAGKDLMERVRLRGLEQILKQNISETIRYDLMSGGEAVTDREGNVIGKELGTTTSINNTYRGLYGTSYKIQIEPLPGETLKDTYIRQCEMTSFPREILDARFETARGLIHFDKDIAENSTVAAEYFHQKRADMGAESIHEMANDNSRSAYDLTGRTNMAITMLHSAGYTDSVLTGSGKNQGIVRYLVEGTQVTPDGKIIPSEDKNARAPIMSTEPMRYRDYIPADRVQMVGSNYLTASGVAGLDERVRSDGRSVKGVGIAQMTLQGLTFDDGAVVSSRFANSMQVLGEGGTLRPMMSGDKICDFAGNKSVEAKVIDVDMSREDAEKAGVLPAWELFRMNPDLDIVQAPYSAVSRFNAASAKLLMEHPMDLKLPDGRVGESCLGFAPVIITCHTAHEHTKKYGDDEIKAGRGRKISAQLAWAFSAKDAVNIMDECFSGNNSVVTNFREMLNVMGLDMDETGELRESYQPHEGESRYVFHLPDEDTIANTEVNDLVNLFSDQVDNRGGFLELPFELELPSGQMTAQLSPDECSRSDHAMYALPVLSAHMRSGQTFEDGTSMTHDYTNQYTRIFSNAIQYLEAEKAGDAKKMYQCKAAVETAYGVITESIRTRKFDTKHNAMRDDFMSHKMPNSATAIWTPDTKLNLDEVAMNSEMMKNLGVEEGEYTMMWRDPILRDYGCRFMKVRRDDSLTGVAVHPLVAISFDGDFDGDSGGLWTPKRAASIREAMAKFSFQNNLLDTTKMRENGDYALFWNDSMDVISAEFADDVLYQQEREAGMPERETLHDRRMAIEHEVNEVYRDMTLSDEERFQKNSALLDLMSEWAHDALNHTMATELISYKDAKTHMQSLVDMVDHGAKGSHKKLLHYAKYFGLECGLDENGHIDVNSIRDTGHTLATEDDVRDTEQATAIKSHGTGNAGAVSQRVVMVARNLGVARDLKSESALTHQDTNALSAALKITYLSTQGILQAKHDPVQAQRLYEHVNDSVRNIWRGRKMEEKTVVDKNGDSRTTWVVKREQRLDGTYGPVQATKEDWVNMFMRIHTHPDGLDLAGSINEDHVRQVADALFDESQNQMYDIESEYAIDKLAAPMDILAYRPSDGFHTLCQMAREHRNIFEGTYNQMFAPKQVRDNIRAKELGEPLKALQAQDTKLDYNAQKKSKSAIELHTVDTSVAEELTVAHQEMRARVDQMDVYAAVDWLDNLPDYYEPDTKLERSEYDAIQKIVDDQFEEAENYRMEKAVEQAHGMQYSMAKRELESLNRTSESLSNLDKVRMDALQERVSLYETDYWQRPEVQEIQAKLTAEGLTVDSVQKELLARKSGQNGVSALSSYETDNLLMAVGLYEDTNPKAAVDAAEPKPASVFTFSAEREKVPVEVSPQVPNNQRIPREMQELAAQYDSGRNGTDAKQMD